MSGHYRILEDRPDGETVMAGEAQSLAEAKKLVDSLCAHSRSSFAIFDVAQQQVVCRKKGSHAS